MKKERRQAIQQKRTRQRQQTFLVIGAVVAVIAVIAIVLYMLNQNVEIPEGAAEKYAGMEQGVTAEGYPRLGSAEAGVTVVEFSSFGCSHCKTFHEEQLSEMYDYIREGQVQVIFKPITSIANTGNEAEKGARAALCAGRQGEFWDMHSIVFNWQGNYSITGNRVEAAGEALGLNVDDLMSCYNSNEVNAVISIAEREFRSSGYEGTPAILVNGRNVNYPSTLGTVEDLLQ